MAALEERVVTFRPRTIFIVLGVAILVALLLVLVYLAWHVITWILIAVFLAAALNPAVTFLERRGLGRGIAAGIVFLAALLAVSGLGFVVVPPLVDQVRQFVDAVPDLVEDITKGRGPLGFLERDYGIVERVRAAVEKQGAGGVLGITTPALAIAQSVVTAVVGTVTVAFLTLFMLLEGPRTVERFLGLLPKSTATRWSRVGGDIYRTIGGYVTGNLLISIVAGVCTTIVLLLVGSDYAVALGLVVAVLDLIPLAGATLAAILVSLVILVELGWVQALIVAGFYVVYQQLENHVLQPVVYGRTVQLSPLAVLIAVLIGAELAGVLGALAAIPMAGSIQAVGREVLEYARNREAPEAV
ncbi:MAG: AI-2E family transporter [Actinobacteria bacterium]|nr:AI-2E family transporter [Actinomycetota bacterium]